jgi:hypothetical protein
LEPQVEGDEDPSLSGKSRNVCDEGGYVEQFEQVVNLDEDRKDGMVTEMNQLSFLRRSIIMKKYYTYI